LIAARHCGLQRERETENGVVILLALWLNRAASEAGPVN
jgi:hypothetical protein